MDVLNEDCVNLLNLHEEVLRKIEYGEQLLESLKAFNKIEGIQKLHAKIKQELSFLKKISSSGSIKKEHLQCSNLTHFSALIDNLRKVKDCVSVYKIYNLDGKKVTVNIICDKGLTWKKVVKRNPKSIVQICMGNGNYGARTIFEQAREYLECAKLNPCMFQSPKVVFVFGSGIGKNLAAKLESVGITVEGVLLQDLDENADYDVPLPSELSTDNTENISKLNLDVSAMLAYCSSVTNGSCDKYEFTVPVLAQQAKWECERPVKPILDKLFAGKKLYCCETAHKNFLNILNTVGGPNERIRGQELIKRLTVLPDNATAYDTTQIDENIELFSNVQFTSDKKLEVGGKIKERSLIIFKFGDRIQAVTVSANDGFVRAAKQQGINFVVFIHESRALTEQKEQKAKKREV